MSQHAPIDHAWGSPWLVVLGFYLAASVTAFIFYAVDKSAARNDRWRTPESTLHFIGLIGGWPGAWIAQKLLRHKSSKPSFLLVYWMTVAIHCGFIGWLFSPYGKSALNTLASLSGR